MSDNDNKQIILPFSISVRDLAEKLEASPIQVIKVLMANGVMASINQTVDFDTAAVVASELGLDAELAKRATFLHDIGKAVSYEMEGPHAAIGAQLAKKYRERADVVPAIEAHHFEVEPKTLTAMLVITADSISASRPGARRESFESYIKRLEQLEQVCNSFPGVEKAFAVQAGREVRIIVQPEKINDDECALLAREVTKRIEADVQYPGQIKVTVLRETRNVEYAR